MPMLTASQAAARMGVKVATIYAYASRGLLERHAAGDGRTSLFDERVVEVLARRGRPRRSSRSTSLDLLIETRLTALSTRGVSYRGRPSAELARSLPFEQVAELLWVGEFADRRDAWTGEIVARRPGVDLGTAIRVIVAELTRHASNEPDLSPQSVAAVGRHLVATVVDSLAGPGKEPGGRSRSTPRLQLPDGGPAIGASIAGRLWNGLTLQRPAPGMTAVLNATLILMADHELATSTLGVRVAASAQADPYAAVLAGLGVLQGALHGGATRLSRELLDDALRHGATRAVTDALAGGRRLPGFGHRVYPGLDPRAALLFDLLRPIRGSHRTMTTVDALAVEANERLGTAPNVDLALAAMTSCAGLPLDDGEAIMAVARMAGWLGHAIEEYAEAPLRFRPRASYVGP